MSVDDFVAWLYELKRQGNEVSVLAKVLARGGSGEKVEYVDVDVNSAPFGPGCGQLPSPTQPPVRGGVLANVKRRLRFQNEPVPGSQ